MSTAETVDHPAWPPAASTLALQRARGLPSGMLKNEWMSRTVNAAAVGIPREDASPVFQQRGRGYFAAQRASGTLSTSP